MKKKLFIILGSVVLLLVFLAWLYLLLFGAPKQAQEVFSNLGLGREATPISEFTESLVQTAELNINAGSLVQLTTRPVAGFDFVTKGTSTVAIRYAEKGTGHIYEVNISDGIETRLLAKTSLAVIDARFAPDGGAVVLIAEGDTNTVTTLEDLSPRNLTHQFPEDAENVQFVSDTKLRYTLRFENGTTGFEYDLEEGTTDVMFGIPLKEAVVLWGREETLVYNPPAPRLRGGLYRISGDALSRLNGLGYAFSATAPRFSSGVYLLTYVDLESGNLASFELDELAATNNTLPIVALPEKCSFDALTNHLVWCAAPSTTLSRNAQSDWYKGTMTFSDLLWQLDLEAGSATVEDDLSAVAGRDIDAVGLTVDSFGSYILFKNKSDDTLWFKNLTFSN
jgi:hypothetical protein